MIIEDFFITDIKLIKNKLFNDQRGFFSEVFNQNQFDKNNFSFIPVQDNFSFNIQKHTIRGLHMQYGESSQAKLVTCIQGSIIDIAVDLRKNSQTFGKYIAVELNSKNLHSLYIPHGFAHGFMTLEDNSSVLYKVDNFYNNQAEIGIMWNDKELNIEWPNYNNITISEKDQTNISFQEYQKLLV